MSWLTMRLSRKDVTPNPGQGGGGGPGPVPAINPQPTNVSPGILMRGKPPGKDHKRHGVDKTIKTPNRKRKSK